MNYESRCGVTNLRMKNDALLNRLTMSGKCKTKNLIHFTYFCGLIK